MTEQKIKFAFVTAAGPHGVLGAGSWRLNVRKEDMYIRDAEVGSKVKVSLHADDAWRCAQTQEDLRSESPILPPGHDRAPWKFTPPPFVNGQRLAFHIGVARSALLPMVPDPKDTLIVVEDRWDRATFAGVWMTEPGVDLTMQDELVGGPLVLASGRRVWLTKRTEPAPAIEPETDIVSSFIEPVSPEINGAVAPGLWIRGVRLGATATA